MTIKTTVLRATQELLETFQREAAAAGMSFNAWMVDAGLKKLGVTGETLSQDVVKGATAEVIIGDGVLYNWTGKRRQNAWKPLYLVSHGKLWQVDRTSNYSHKILRAVSVVPKCLIDKATGERGDYIPKLLELSSGSMLDTLAVLLELETQEWFQNKTAREQEYVIDAAIFEGWTVERLTAEYCPVITKPEEVVATVVEVKEQKLKACGLMERYGIDGDMWRRMVGTWKDTGLTTVDGLVWNWVQRSNIWVSTT